MPPSYHLLVKIVDAICKDVMVAPFEDGTQNLWNELYSVKAIIESSYSSDPIRTKIMYGIGPVFCTGYTVCNTQVNRPD